MSLLAGKSALVTGGGRGIGRAATLALAGAGANVAPAARTLAQVQATASQVQAMGRRALPLQMDVTDYDAVQRGVQAVCAAFGGLDIVVHAAAVVEPLGKLWTCPVPAWQRAVEIGVRGTFNVVHSAIPHMFAGQGGRVVLLSSPVGHKVFPNFSAYAVSKAGVDQLVRVLAEELAGTGVAINAVYPGQTDTDMHARIRATPREQLGDEMWQYFQQAKLDGRLLPPDAPAQLILYLASPLAEGISGRIVAIEDAEVVAWLAELEARKGGALSEN